jgi:acetylornithine deacetylase/succinyl-diaminopimelate desuccinylase-like protein
MSSILEYIEINKSRHLGELKEFIAIPSISTNQENGPDIQRCSRWVANHLTAIGMEHVRIVPTGNHPMVYADWLHAEGKPTLLIYGHYDVQPVDPLDQWLSPPFEATVRDGNLYARGTADDKGQIFIHFKAIEAFSKTTGGPPINIKFLIEGEEEIGSPNLESFVKTNYELLSADLVVISDSAMFAKGVPSICYGLRGLSYMEVELTGPNRDLHSGTFGGSIHNPIQALSELIASLHDRNGRVTIPGFYDDVRPLSKKERDAYKKLPFKEKDYAKDLGVHRLYGEKGFTTLERIWARPTLECNGMWGGFIADGVKTVIPSKAAAKISMRLVPDQDPDTIARLFTKHIKKISPKTSSVVVRTLHGGKPAITPIESPGVKAAISALKKAFGKTPLYQREGGSIPIVVQFEEILGISTVLLGFGLPDENSHSPNEFLNLDNFYGGIKTSMFLMEELSQLPVAVLRRKRGKRKS